MDTFPGRPAGVEGAAVGTDAGVVGEATEELILEVKGLPVEERYQFASGSPKHSPTVTALNPFCCKFWSIKAVKL